MIVRHFETDLTLADIEDSDTGRIDGSGELLVQMVRDYEIEVRASGEYALMSDDDLLHEALAVLAENLDDGAHTLGQRAIEACRQIAWKLNHNDEHGPAKIDRNDAVAHMAQAIADRAGW